MTDQMNKGVTNQAFARMKDRIANTSPEDRQAQRDAMQAQVADMKARGVRVVENATGHRLMIQSTGLGLDGADEGRNS
jgi:hypothetical protein